MDSHSSGVLFEVMMVLETLASLPHGASAAALAFGEARFSLLYWLRRHGSAVVELARQAAATGG